MPVVLVFLIAAAVAWYVLIQRPQRQHAEQHQSLVGQISVGNFVMTVGGVYGKVLAVAPDSVLLEVAPHITVRVATDGIARIVSGGEATFAQQQTEQIQHLAAGAQQPAAQAPAPAPVYAAPVQPGPVHTFRAQIGQPQPYQPAPPAFPNVAAAQPLIQAPQIQAPQYGAPLVQPPMPVVQAIQQPQPVAPATHVVAQSQQVDANGRPFNPRRSQPPSGFGPAARANDPKMAQTLDQAREERRQLAEDMRATSGPLVTTADAPPPPAVPAAAPAAPHAGVFAGAAGAPPAPLAPPPAPQLFVHPSQGQAPAAAQQQPLAYPARPALPVAQPAATQSIPAPGITAASPETSAGFPRSPFTTRVPYSPRDRDGAAEPAASPLDAAARVLETA